MIERLKIFTFHSRAELERLTAMVATEPFRREAQRALALEVTTLVHGAPATQAAIAASAALFGQGELAQLDTATLETALRELPHTTTTASTPVVQLLVDTGLATSLSESRRALEQGGVYLNNIKVVDAAVTLVDNTLPGGMAVLRRGKKTLAGIFVE